MSPDSGHTRTGPVARREKVLDALRKHVSVGAAVRAEFMHSGVETRSRGPHVWDEEDNKYLDCGGFGVFLLGHCHPRVVDAVVDQVRTHPTSTYLLVNSLEADAAETLARVVPPGLDHVHFGLSGADAVETAIKLARLNGRRRLIAMQNGYHGMTLGALSITSGENHRQPFEPLLQDVELVPFGDVDALVAAVAHGPAACVVLEPVQAEGGVIVPPDGYLRQVEQACRQHGALLVLDEIQTGLGRLGAWWGADRDGVSPDVLLAGKALGGGIVPVSAAVGTAQLFRPLSRNPLLHTSTFSGAPIAMAAVKATIAVIEEEHLVARAAALGERVRELVATAVADTCPSLVREVRGAGLLVGIEWTTDFHALDFLTEMLDRRVILSYAMNAPRVIRLTPPAILSEEDLEVLDSAIRASATALMSR